MGYVFRLSTLEILHYPVFLHSSDSVVLYKEVVCDALKSNVHIYIKVYEPVGPKQCTCKTTPPSLLVTIYVL